MAAVQVESSSVSQPTSVPRKRRRRAPTTGAAEDCFACRKRDSTCDRRRPYCSQCLEVGNECSGYRTTLTWGVGVASRGKLRGMACPILAATDQSLPSSRHVKPRNQLANAAATGLPPAKSSAEGQQNQKRPRTNSCRSIGSDLVDSKAVQSSTDAHKTSAASRQNSWQLPEMSSLPRPEDLAGSVAGGQRKPQPVNLHRLQTSLMPHCRDAVNSPLTGSMDAAGSLINNIDTPCDPAIQFPPTPVDAACGDAFVNRAGLHPYNTPHFVSHQQPEPPTSHPHYMVDEKAYQNGFNDMKGPQLLSQDALNTPLGSGGINGLILSDHTNLVPAKAEDSTPIEDSFVPSNEYGTDMGDASAVSLIPRSVFDMQFFNLPPRLQNLMDYYDKAICPFLVAFDGHVNPYRMHVLHLAMENPALQNAIAALATNNMRMRDARDMLELTDTPSLKCRDGAEDFSSTIARPTAEELHYKSRSIQHLNVQLTDPMRARDDSVLATLVILCLFHVCDSGFSKFKTQLAGVQKLLKMRGNGLQSEFVGWVEMFFAWFDVMTSAVNDRETQIQSDSLDLMDLNANLGALEQFSGCDGRLFKLIARLGRLNLLSQDRPVRDMPATPRRPSSPEPSLPKDYYSLHDDQLYSPPQSIATTEDDSPWLSPDDRPHFWREWRDIRARLHEWELDPLLSPSNNATTALPGPQRDLLHISESFRYSALLYTERLAHPSLPSSSPNFQGLVAHALAHIADIGTNSCVTKFLLWPLFVTGTECVQEAHRDLIRGRCLEIQKESGFYNNLSGLEVLERVWREGDGGAGMADGSGLGGGAQAFRWRRAMDRVDGEYIVI